MNLDLDRIKELIPHRHPFLFIDSCKIVEKGMRGISKRKFLPSEYFFEGHFPSNPIVPGVIIVEAMAQTAGIVVSHSFEEQNDKSVLFMSVNKAKFRKPIKPNDTIEFEVKFLNKVKSVYKFEGIAKKNEIIVSQSEFSAMITFGNILK